MVDQPTRQMEISPTLEKETLVPPPRRRRGFFRRWFVRFLKLGVVLGVLGIAVCVWMYQVYVVRNPGEHLERDYILSLISQEAPVYYRDGTTRLGVFFSEEHRQYVPYESIPDDFVNALVAAEDQDFFDHPGFSPRGITRAFMVNLRAGRVVAGGSTLTQQTAKNLYKRQGRTYKEKLRELANALRLERLYTKEDILEFYSNQFYVNGNGRGLPIAARFFFDKDLDELELVECAFLAGVVKSPNRYNPWVPGAERQERAARAARERADYVLDRMFEDGYIDAQQHADAKAAPIPFSRGHFRYDRSVVLDEIENELTRPSFQRLLAEYGVSDLGTSGLQVRATIDEHTQLGAQYALRHHLTEVGILLEAPELDALLGDELNLRPLDADRVRPFLFHRGLLTGVDAKARTATVDLGGVAGTLDATANLRLTQARKRAGDRNTWAQASRKEVTAQLEEIEPLVGRSVLVSIRELDDSGAPILDWEWEPELQGAVVVLDAGEVVAMVGGSRNADFNRATMARRQLGSTWKPILFDTALQLKWSTTDPLDNRRAVFPYQGTFYYPRPDHRGAPEEVSIAWAATKSENLASVWLLFHLLDRLNPEQFRQIAQKVDMVPRPGEEQADFVARVQKAGVLPTSAKLSEGIFEQVRSDLVVDLEFAGREGEADALAAMYYGLGFEDELEEVRSDSSLPVKEKKARVGALSRSLLRQEALAVRFSEARSVVLDRMAQDRPIDQGDLAGFSVSAASVDDGPARLSFGDRVPDGFEELTPDRLDSLLVAPTAPREEPALEVEVPAEDDVDRLFGPDPDEPVEPAPTTAPDPPPASDGPTSTVGRSFALTALLDPDTVLLEGQLTPALVREVRGATDRARAELGASAALYSPDMLALCRDFRTLVALRYVVAVARRAGVRSPIVPVLSLPLGSSDITLLEAAQVYQLILTGGTYRFFPDALAADATVTRDVDDIPDAVEPYDDRRADEFPDSGLIAEIQLADGRVIYKADREILPATSAGLAADMGGVLRKVVSHGTGRRAEAAVRVSSHDPDRADRLAGLDVHLPLFGKTGTTNSYKNSAFLGVVPGLPPQGDSLTWGHGQVVAAYVGYDDNREMKRGSIRIQGASGSLPVWIGAARAAAFSSDIGDRVDLADLAFSGGRILPMDWLDEQVGITVDLRTGLPLDGSDPADGEGTTTLYRRRSERSFEPFRPLEGPSE